MCKFFVYELIDPRDDTVFYIGKGTRNRPRQHVWDSNRSRENTPKANKIRKILAAGLQVGWRKVFETDDEVLAYAEEVRRIAAYGASNLTNATAGGLGNSAGHTASEETRRRMSLASKGRAKSAAQRANMSAARLGIKLGPEHRASISAALRRRPPVLGRIPTQQQREKTSAALRGRGLGPKGERQGNSKLTEAKVRNVFELRRQGLSQLAISLKVGVAQPTISKILLGQRWGHLGLVTV